MEEQKIEKKKRGGKMPGAGRPKGRKNDITLEREAFLEEWKNAVARRTKTLLNVQTLLAVGSIKVFCIITEVDAKGVQRRSKPELVVDDEEIIAALDYEYGDGDSLNDEERYYFVTTKDPDNAAINSLMDRTFGKPKESVDLKHSGGIGLADLLGKSALDEKKE